MTRRVLAALRLPIPLDAFDSIGRFIERAYGTGATMMQADGETIHILEPEGGLEDRVRAGEPAIDEAESSEMLLRYLELRDGCATISIEDASNALLLIAEVMHRWFESQGGTNFVELTLHFDRPGGEPEGARPDYVFTMQRADGVTPAAKATDAEERLRRINEFMNAPVEGNDFYLSGFESRWDELSELYDPVFVTTLRGLLGGS